MSIAEELKQKIGRADFLKIVGKSALLSGFSSAIIAMPKSIIEPSKEEVKFFNDNKKQSYITGEYVHLLTPPNQIQEWNAGPEAMLVDVMRIVLNHTKEYAELKVYGRVIGRR